MLKAYEAISIDDLSPLGVRPSHELMSSYMHKVMQLQIVNEGFALRCVLFSHSSSYFYFFIFYFLNFAGVR